MKNCFSFKTTIIGQLRLLIIILSLCVPTGCEDEPKTPVKYNVSGTVEKGPYILGSTILIQELDGSFNPTGRSFTTQTIDDFGRFSTSISLLSSKVQITAQGFYFNEVSGSLSEAPLTLRAIVDLANGTDIVLNVLTTMVHDRILSLAGNGFSGAKSQAENELLISFGLQTLASDFENLDITQSEILLGISAILQGRLTVAGVSELLARINQDLAANGAVGQPQMNQLRTNAGELSPADVQQNLSQRYEKLGLSITAPNIEDIVRLFLTGTLSAAPVITSFSPALGTAGDTVTITGQYFSVIASKNTVKFGSHVASVVSSTSESIKCIVPENVQEASTSIIIATAGKSVVSSGNFTFAAPVITSFSPALGTAGDTVTITGQYFSATASQITVKFGSYASTVVSSTSKSIKCIVPASVPEASAAITIAVTGKSAVSSGNFTFAAPLINSFSPTEGNMGDLVTIRGKYLGRQKYNVYVKFDEYYATVLEATDTVLKVKVPGEIKFRSNKITVSFNLRTGTSTQDFIVLSIAVNPVKRVSTLPGILSGRGSSGSVAFSVGGKGYVGLGSNAGNRFWSFDPTSASWTEIAPYPGTGTYHWGITTFSFNGFGYLHGWNEFWKYDPSLNTWSLIANVNHGKGLSNGQKVYFFHPEVTDNFWEFNPANGAWTKKSNAPITRGKPVFIINNKFYVLIEDPAQPELWEYDIANSTWSKKATPDPQTKGPGFAFNGRGYTSYSENINGSVVSYTFRYDPASNSWTRPPALNAGPVPVFFEINGTPYVGAGWFGEGVDASLYEFEPWFFTQ